MENNDIIPIDLEETGMTKKDFTFLSQSKTMVKKDINTIRKDIDIIQNESETINEKQIAKELIVWITRNVENFINNQQFIFKLDIVLDDNTPTIEEMENLRKLQDLYRLIPDDELMIEYNELRGKTEEIRIKLDKIVEKVYHNCHEETELMDNLFKRMAYYYELRGVHNGRLLLQELTGKVTIKKFEYEAFSMAVQVRNGQDKKIINEYVIPEGFSVVVEIVCTPVTLPSSIF